MRSKHYAYIFSALYASTLLAMFCFGKVTIRPAEQPERDIIYIEMVEPEPPKPKPKPVPKAVVAPRHDVASPQDNTQQVTGKDEDTRTVNTKALFKMTKDGADKEISGGNIRAKKDTETTASGEGGGYAPIGNEQLDKGLQGRGLVGELPKPSYPPVNEAGKVVIYVKVDASGCVTDAEWMLEGSTTQNQILVKAALEAAKKTRFTESKAFIQGGRITYVFNLK